MDTDFSDWLTRELQERDWSQAYLARKAGINRQVISTYINRQRSKPDTEVLSAIAKALDYQDEVVYRAAGILDPIPPDDQRVENWRAILRLLTPEEEAELREIGLLKIKRREAAARLLQERRKQPPGHND